MFESASESAAEATTSCPEQKKARNTDKTMYTHFIKTGTFVIHGRERKRVEQLKCRYCNELFLYHKVRNLKHLEKVHGFNIHSDSFSTDPSRGNAGHAKMTEAPCDKQTPRARASSSNHQSSKSPRILNDPVHTYFERTGRFTTHGREKKKVEYLKCRCCDESFLSHKLRNLRHLQKNHGYSVETNTFDPERAKQRFSHIEVSTEKKFFTPRPRFVTSSASPVKNSTTRATRVNNHTIYLDHDKMKKACDALTKVLFIKNIPFDTFEDGTWNEFFSIVSPPFEPPSARDIATKYLCHHFNRTMAATHDALKSAGKIALSISQSRFSSKVTFINLIAFATRPYILDCIEVGDNALTSSFLENLLTEFLSKQRSNGIEFMALITDDSPLMKSLRQTFHKGKMLADSSTIKLLPVYCVRHCINLLMKDLLNLSVVQQKLHLISSFGAEIKKSPDLKRVYEEYALICGAETKTTCNATREPRWMYNIDLMAGIYQERAIIQTIFSNKDTNDLDSLLSDRSGYEKMKKDEFWTELNDIHTALKPLQELIVLNETTGATIADAYITLKTFMQSKDKLLKLLDRKTASSVDTKLLEYYSSLISDHHELASFLHPHYRLSEFNSKNIAAYIKILKSVSECVCLTSEESSQAVKELVDYFAFTSPFERESFENCTEHSMSAISWWKAFGQQTQLKKVALILLSIPAFNCSVDQALPQDATSFKTGDKFSPSRVKMLTTIKFFEAFVKKTGEDTIQRTNIASEMFNSRSLKAVANDLSEVPIFSDESEDETTEQDLTASVKDDPIVIAVNTDVLGDLIQSTGIEATDSLNYQITLPQGVAVEWNNINLRQVDSDEIQMSS